MYWWRPMKKFHKLYWKTVLFNFDFIQQQYNAYVYVQLKLQSNGFSLQMKSSLLDRKQWDEMTLVTRCWCEYLVSKLNICLSVVVRSSSLGLCAYCIFLCILWGTFCSSSCRFCCVTLFLCAHCVCKYTYKTQYPFIFTFQLEIEAILRKNMAFK